MDLFHHKMFKSRFFCSLSIPLNFCCLLFNLISVKIKKMSFSRRQSGKFQITNIINISCIFQNCRNIRSYIGFAVCHSNNHWTVFSCYPNFSRIIFEHKFQSIGTTHTNHRFGNRINRSEIILLIIIVH